MNNKHNNEKDFKFFDKVSRAFFKNIKTSFDLILNVGLKTDIVILDFDIRNANGLVVAVEGVKVLIVDGSAFKTVKVCVAKTSKISICGECESCSITAYNGSFYNVSKEFIIPLKNLLVAENGTGLQLYSYSNINNFNSGDFIPLDGFENVCTVQSVVVGGVYATAIAGIMDNAYICLETDNYSNKTYISDEVNDVDIVPCSDDGFYVLYLKDGLKYKKYDKGILGEENLLAINGDNIPVRFMPVEYVSLKFSAFLLQYENNLYGLYLLENDGFKQKLLIKGDYVKVCQCDDSFYVFVINGYKLKVIKYFINSKNLSFECQSIRVFNNVDNGFIVDNKLVVSNNGYYSEIDEI